MTYAHTRHHRLLGWRLDKDDVQSDDEEFEELPIMRGMQPIGSRFYYGANVYRFFDSSGCTRCWCRLVGRRWNPRLTANEAERAVRELIRQGLMEDSQDLFMWWAATNAQRQMNQRRENQRRENQRRENQRRENQR
ncbi:hypothetical protein TsFJ059_003808 [Trichoderma semiorbis]|uniref:Uncharacterized protein n=1 Tax=Trichoderma semiorbis TaxID=1491008 RepID=A0A9P8HS99_9HYPO|nr:hypothetical protein TsFJ059_003808 [Trichoderma semiorbis]